MNAETSEQPAHERDREATLLVFLAALAPRLWVALAWAKEPVWDGHYYDFGARRIAAGLGYSDDLIVNGVSRWHPWCHYPVGYSGFLGLIYKVFGSGQSVAPLANALVGATLAALVFPVYDPGLGALEATRLAPEAALHLAIESGSVPDGDARSIHPLARMCNEVPAWHLAYADAAGASAVVRRLAGCAR